MKIVVSGFSGLIGSALKGALGVAGHDATGLVRKRGVEGIFWDPGGGKEIRSVVERGEIDRAGLEKTDAVIHLAGEPIGGGRWTAGRKARIRESRVGGTALLCDALQRLHHPPHTLICASAIGFYGDRGEEVVNEETPAGRGFLAEVCQAWEEPARQISPDKTRVVHLRFGMVLSARGGALAQLLPWFNLGLGGVLGHGRQYMSWVAIDDVVGAIWHVLERKDIRGPVNVVSPRPVTNREFTKTLAGVLGRPALLPAPAFALRLVLGEMADALLLSSARVEPRRLLQSGYVFQYAELADALRHLLLNNRTSARGAPLP